VLRCSTIAGFRKRQIPLLLSSTLEMGPSLHCSIRQLLREQSIHVSYDGVAFKRAIRSEKVSSREREISWSSSPHQKLSSFK
jgi:hypothetical protein